MKKRQRRKEKEEKEEKNQKKLQQSNGSIRLLNNWTKEEKNIW